MEYMREGDLSQFLQKYTEIVTTPSTPTLTCGKFSEKSDVWAFGVTIWEMFTLAKDIPYPHLSDDEVVHSALKRGFPSRSAACPETVYKIMERCWIVYLNQYTIHKTSFNATHLFVTSFLLGTNEGPVTCACAHAHNPDNAHIAQVVLLLTVYR